MDVHYGRTRSGCQGSVGQGQVIVSRHGEDEVGIAAIQSRPHGGGWSLVARRSLTLRLGIPRQPRGTVPVGSPEPSQTGPVSPAIGMTADCPGSEVGPDGQRASPEPAAVSAPVWTLTTSRAQGQRGPQSQFHAAVPHERSREMLLPTVHPLLVPEARFSPIPHA